MTRNSGNINLTCLAVTHDKNNLSQFDLSYQWYNDGRSISVGSVHMSDLVANGNTLHVGAGARGTIQCISTNRAGSVSVSINLCEYRSVV